MKKSQSTDRPVCMASNLSHNHADFCPFSMESPFSARPYSNGYGIWAILFSYSEKQQPLSLVNECKYFHRCFGLIKTNEKKRSAIKQVYELNTAT